jgi:hypothetical protein
MTGGGVPFDTAPISLEIALFKNKGLYRPCPLRRSRGQREVNSHRACADDWNGHRDQLRRQMPREAVPARAQRRFRSQLA